jgi:queuine/archaeosine tRNA-ribosyltransferase
MLDDTLTKIESQIQNSHSVGDARKRELLELLAKLKTEVAELSKTHDEQAKSITGFTQVSTHEATRESRDPNLLKLSVEGLRTSASGFEESHPNLVRIVNAISNTLSNLGI